MQGNSVAEVLRALATSDKARSETARLRDVVGEVEAALSAGVSRAAVLAALHGQGFTMTAKSFESALYRLRKKMEKSNPGRPETSVTPSTKPAIAIQATPAPAGETRKITNPAGIRDAKKRQIDLDDYTNDEQGNDK